MSLVHKDLPEYLRLKPPLHSNYFTSDDEAREALEAHTAIFHQRVSHSQSNNLCTECSKYDLEFELSYLSENEELLWQAFEVLDEGLSDFAGPRPHSRVIRPSEHTSCPFCIMLIKIFQEHFPDTAELLDDIDVKTGREWAGLYQDYSLLTPVRHTAWYPESTRTYMCEL